MAPGDEKQIRDAMAKAFGIDPQTSISRADRSDRRGATLRGRR